MICFHLFLSMRRIGNFRFHSIGSVLFICCTYCTLSGDRSLSGNSPLRELFLLCLILRGKESFEFTRLEHTSALAPVPGDPGIAGGESDHTAAAVVLAALADQSVDLGKSKIMQSFKSDEGGRRAGPAGFLHGCMRGADGSHQARIGRTDNFPAYILFDRAEYRVIAEGTALNDDPVPQGIQTADADDLCKNILNDGAAKSGQNIVDLPAVFLLGDNTAVHKDRAAASQHSGVFCGKGALRDLRRGNAHVFGKIFQEGTAACGAGLVDHDVRYDAVVDPDRLHVLAADIKDKGGVLQILGAGPSVGNRLNNVRVGAEGLGCQQFAVAGRRHTSDMEPDALRRELFLHLDQALSQDRNGIAAVVGIEGIQNPLFFIEKDKLGRCGTAVDTEIAVCICARVKLAENMLVFIQGMTPEESLIVRFRRKKRTGFGSLLLNIPAPDQGADPVNALVEIKVVGCTCRSARIKGSAERNHELRLLRDQNILILQLQLFPEGLDQGRMEAERAALENDRRRHDQTLGKTAYGLFGNGMQSRQGDIFFAHALVQQRLDICFCIDAAAA